MKLGVFVTLDENIEEFEKLQKNRFKEISCERYYYTYGISTRDTYIGFI